jgi:acyl-homoserine lactone acylase PvdQ
VLALAVATGAGAQVQPPGTGDPGGFSNVLGVGQGGNTSATDLAQNVATGRVPPSFTNQLDMYRDLGPLAPGVNAGNLGRFFKPAGFGVEDARVTATLTPRPGVTILVDDLEIPHVYGNSRADVHFGAGYASARARLFQMDVLRHTARGELIELTGLGEGNSSLNMDVGQLRVADYTEQELQGMIDSAAANAGAEGAEMKQDLSEYVAGINAFIAQARTNPTLMPAEYAALGVELEDWKATDSAAVASLIGGIFGKGGGVETRVAAALSAARQRFGHARGSKVFKDFRSLNDPEAPVTTPKRFRFPDPRRRRGKGIAIPDPGSVQDYDPVVGGAPQASGAGSRAVPWLERLRSTGLDLDGPASNATLVRAADSVSGKPLGVTGPQVSYYSPEILFEMDLHGGGVDTRGVAFPGISLYVLLGRGKDFSWSATTATTDNVDEFVERLCQPDGSAPTRASVHYRYKGQCVPMTVQERTLTTPGPSVADPGASSQQVRLRLLRTVHGPVTRTATLKGAPVAIASARSTYFHELDSTLAFKRLNRNEVTDAASFHETMSRINFLFNWFYNDERDIAYLQSGWFPIRARGTDPSLPTLGNGKFDWRNFDSASYNSARAGFARLPKDVNPRRGYIVSWNNKQAPGWRAADDVWSFNSVQRSERLEDRVRAAIRGAAKIDLPRLVSIMGDAGTTDLRGQEVWPWLRRLIGRPRDAEERRLVGLLGAWTASGSNRVDRDGDNAYEHSGAVALMDAWWEPLVRGIYERRLGTPLFDRIRALNTIHQQPGPGGSAFFDGWYGYVEKDLRSLMGRRVRGRYSRIWCGGGPALKKLKTRKAKRRFKRKRRAARRRCRAIAVRTLKGAAPAAEARYGAPLETLKVPATCAEQSPQACDQITFTATGAIATPPIPWQDRGTFQQAVEVQGNRP